MGRSHPAYGLKTQERTLESNNNGKMSVGKPRKKWVNAVEIESRKILKVSNWKRESTEKQAWSRHLRKVRARLRVAAPNKEEEVEDKRKKESK
jgi:hypothetical protein